jgi:hypothetical protein
LPIAGTNIGAGIQAANDILLQASPDESKYIILLSDGLTNEGLPPDQILSGPVQQAVQAGACIYTIGFGDPGALDENLLRSIAQASGCGQYYYATDLRELEKIYIRIRHQAAGTILAEFSGEVAQGEIAPAGSFSVPAGQGELAVSLHWPGSKLSLRLTDPQGTLIDQNDPQVNVVSYANLVYALVLQPLPGDWFAEVVGVEVPQASESFDLVVSARQALVTPPPPTPPPPAPQAGGGVSAALLVIVLGGGAVALYVYAILLRRRRTSSTLGIAPGAPAAELIVLKGPDAGRSIPLSGDWITIGRGRDNQIVLTDSAVSRQHAVLRRAEGDWFIQDMDSKFGTYVNNHPISAQRLESGARIALGSSELIFRKVSQAA